MFELIRQATKYLSIGMKKPILAPVALEITTGYLYCPECGFCFGKGTTSLLAWEQTCPSCLKHIHREFSTVAPYCNFWSRTHYSPILYADIAAILLQTGLGIGMGSMMRSISSKT